MNQPSARRRASDPRMQIMQRPFVPLPVETFRRAYAVFSAAVRGELPPAHDLPAEVLDAATGQPARVKDTPFNRGWMASARLFDDEAQRISFGKRVELMHKIIKGEYRKHVNFEAGSIHVALLGAIAQVPFSARTNPKAMRAGFAAEFRKQMLRAKACRDFPSIH